MLHCIRCGKPLLGETLVCRECEDIVRARAEAETGEDLSGMSSGMKDSVYEHAENVLKIPVRDVLTGKRDGKYEHVVDPSMSFDDYKVGMIITFTEVSQDEGIPAGQYIVYDVENVLDGVGDILMKPTKAMDYPDALTLIKYGHKVRRAGWNGKGMWVMLIGPGDYSITIPLIEGQVLPLRPWIGIKIVDGSFGPWVASQADQLATDWELVQDE